MSDMNDDDGIRAWAEQGAAEEALFEILPPAEPERGSKPDTTALAIRGGISEITKTLDAFDKLAAELTDLAAKYPPNLVYDLTTKKGMAEAIEHRAAYRDRRTLLEKLRKAGKAPVLSLGKDIDARAAKLTADFEAGEKPVHQQIKAYEDAKAAEKKARDDAETARVMAIQEALHELHMEGEVKAGTPSSAIAERLETMKALVLDQAIYQEQMRDAEAARALVVAKLTTAMDARRYAEAEAARLAAERAELEELRRQAAERKRSDDEVAEAKRIADAAAAKAAADELAEAQRKLAADQEAVRAEAARLAAIAQEQAEREERVALAADTVETSASVLQMLPDAVEAGAMDAEQAERIGSLVASIAADAVIDSAKMADAPATPPEEATIKLGDVCGRIGVTMSAEFVTETLGVPRRVQGGRAVLFYPSDFERIRLAFIAHLEKLA